MTEQNKAAQYTKLTPSQIAALTADAQGWKPEDGDELQGTVLAIKQGTSDVMKRNDGRYPIVFVLIDSGECIAVHCFQTVLYNEIVSQRPKLGETVYIKRVGVDTNKEVKKGESPTIRFAVYVHREGNDDPWTHMDMHTSQGRA